MIWFERAFILILLAPLALSWWYLRKPARAHKQFLAGFPQALREAFVREPHKLSGHFARGLYLALGCLLVFALAEPRLATPETRGDRDLTWILALDLSDASVASPDDLLALKVTARSMLDESAGSSVALLAFSGSAHWVLPPTRDRALLSRFLEALDPSLMPLSGRDLGALAETLVGHSSFKGDIPVVVLTKTSVLKREPETGAVLTQRGARPLLKAFDGYESGSLALDLARQSSSSGDDVIGMALERYLVAAALILSFVLWRTNVSRALVSSVFVFVVLAPFPSHIQAQPVGGWAGEESDAGRYTSEREQAKSESKTLHDSLLGVFLTPDQRGLLWLNMGNPERAARSFDTPIYQAWAHYMAGDFRMAAQAAQRDRSVQARFLEANAWAHGASYGRALRVYDEILSIEPDHLQAAHNREQVWNLVKAAAEQGESQLPDTGEIVRLESDQSDDASTTKSDEVAIVMTLQAARLLSDPEALRRWRAQVEADPKRFLANRFSSEARRNAAQASQQEEQSDAR